MMNEFNQMKVKPGFRWPCRACGSRPSKLYEILHGPHGFTFVCSSVCEAVMRLKS